MSPTVYHLWNFSQRVLTNELPSSRTPAFNSSQASASVMAITKCLIWVPTVSGFKVVARALSQGVRTSDGWSALACLMDKDHE
jgi:hypothetical protein